MAVISSNAYFASCTADGHDTNRGLSGISGKKAERHRRQAIFDFISDFHDVVIFARFPEPQSIHDFRLKTIQVMSLSRKAVQFRVDRMRRPRQQNVRYELEHEDSKPESGRASWQAKVLNSSRIYSDIHPWTLVVDEYIQRNLIYGKDILPKVYTRYQQQHEQMKPLPSRW